MDTTTDQSHNELHELQKKIQKGLDDMLAFNNNLSRFDKRTLELFLTLTLTPAKFEETLKKLEKIENDLL